MMWFSNCHLSLPAYLATRTIVFPPRNFVFPHEMAAGLCICTSISDHYITYFFWELVILFFFSEHYLFSDKDFGYRWIFDVKKIWGLPMVSCWGGRKKGVWIFSGHVFTKVKKSQVYKSPCTQYARAIKERNKPNNKSKPVLRKLQELSGVL